jgi:hypothetical protein
MNDETHRPRTPLAKPAEERTSDQSTQEAGGLHRRPAGVRSGGGPELAHEKDADSVLERSAKQRYRTPRRYESDEEDAAMPSNESSLNTKI